MIQAPTYLPKNRATQTSGRPPSGHLDYLDGLRALAAFWVVLSHLWISQFGLKAHPGRLGQTTNWLLYSHLAVDVFIVLSGFCLTLPVARDGGLAGGALLFLWRRVRRILPPFYAALALSVWVNLLLQRLEPQPPTLDSHALLINLLLLQDLYLPLNIFNGPFWSIAVEWRIYFLFPAFVWLLFKRGKWTVLALSALLGGAATLTLQHWHPEMLLACPWYLFLFALGICAGASTNSSALRSPVFVRLCLLMAAACLTVTADVLHAHPILDTGGKDFGHILPVLDSVVGLVVSVLLLVLHARPQWMPLLSWRPLAWLGTFAYSLYLIHMPCLLLFSRLLTLWWPVVTDPLARVKLLSLTLPLILGLAYLFFLAFEKPFLRRFPSRIHDKPGMLTKRTVFADNQRITRRETKTNA